MTLFDTVPTYRLNLDTPDAVALKRCAGLSGRATQHPDNLNKRSRNANTFHRLLSGTETVTFLDISDARAYLASIRDEYARSIEAFRTGALKTTDPVDIEAAEHLVTLFSGYVADLDAAIDILADFLTASILSTINP